MARKIALIDRMKSGVRYIATSVTKDSELVKRGDILIKRKGSIIHRLGPLSGPSIKGVKSIDIDFQHYQIQSAIHFQKSMEAAYMTHGDANGI